MDKYQDFSDVDLIEAYKSGHDLTIIGELYKRYKHIVLGICLKYLGDRSAAEDAQMELFEELIKALKKANVRQFKPWLGTVTRNYLHRKHKIESRHQVSSLDDALMKNGDQIMELAQKNAPIINEKEEIEEKEMALLKAVKDLKKEQAQCIRLFYLEDCSYVEVCERTGYSFKEVKSYLQNGKRNLKNILKG